MQSDDLLREHYGRMADGHPDNDDWERLAMDELTPHDKARLLDHASRCTECALLLRGLHALEREALQVDAERTAVLTRGTREGSRRWLGGVLAAAAALLVAVSFSVLAPERSTEMTVRSFDPSRPEPLGPVGKLQRRPESFVFRPALEGSRFSVELLDEAGTPIWKSRSSTLTTVPWPAELVPRPGRYYWRVFETDDDGAVTASPITAFDLPPE